MDCSRKKHMLFDDPIDLHLAEKNRFCPRSGAFCFLPRFSRGEKFLWRADRFYILVLLNAQI